MNLFYYLFNIEFILIFFIQKNNDKNINNFLYKKYNNNYLIKKIFKIKFMSNSSLLYNTVPKNSKISFLQKKLPENYYDRPSIETVYTQFSDHLSEDDTDNPNLKPGKSTITMASIQIGNTILGAGIISLPVVVRYLGIIIGSLFIILVGILSNFAVFLLLKAHQITKKNEYSTIAKATLGDKGFLFVNIMIILNNFGICCAYFRIFGETIKNILAGFLSSNNYLITNWHNYIYIIFLIVILFFIIFTENIQKFEKTSFLGIIGISIYFLGIFINFFYKFSKKILPSFSSKHYFPSGSIPELLISLPSVFLAFSFHMNTFELYSTLKQRNHRSMLISSSNAINFCIFLYVYSGLFGFFMYNEKLNDTILVMLSEDIEDYKNNHFIKTILILTNLGFLTCSTTSIPLMFFSLKTNFLGAVDYYYKKSQKKKNSDAVLNSFINKENQNIYNNNNYNNKNNISYSKINININSNSNSNNISNNNININSNSNSNSNSKSNSFSLNSNNFSNSNTESNIEENVSKRTKTILTIIIYLMIGIVTILIPNLKTVKILLIF